MNRKKSYVSWVHEDPPPPAIFYFFLNRDKYHWRKNGMAILMRRKSWDKNWDKINSNKLIPYNLYYLYILYKYIVYILYLYIIYYIYIYTTFIYSLSNSWVVLDDKWGIYIRKISLGFI